LSGKRCPGSRPTDPEGKIPLVCIGVRNRDYLEQLVEVAQGRLFIVDA
jgi:hypothetical protein